MTLIEAIAAVAIFSLTMVVVGRISLMKASEQVSIDKQYGMLAADAFLADIYDDFHKCKTMKAQETDAGQLILMFELLDGGSNVYSFNSRENLCYKNGISQFKATAFNVSYTVNSLNVSVKLPEERLLEINIFK